MKKSNFTDINFGCRTDVGCVREHNEDSLFAQAPLFVVADGMGGHAAGEVASEIAIETMERCAPRSANVDALADAVATANQEVIRGAMEGRGRQGMGTTITAAVLDGEALAIAQVGDSRAYLLSNGNLQQITRDHSLMADMIEAGQITPAEARVHPNRSLITRALGSDPNMFADTYELTVNPGDRLLLCSDGLTGMITDDTVRQILQSVNNPQQCADKLVDSAIEAGGSDNITVIVVDIPGFSAKKQRKMKNKTRRTFIIVICLFFVILAAAIAGGVAYVQNSAYLTDDDGYVAIYKGVQGNFAGISLSSHVETTDVKISDLRQSTQDHFSEGIVKVSSLDSAYNIIDNYREEAEAQKELKKSQSSSSNSSNKTDSSSSSNSSNSSSSSSSSSNNSSSTNSSNGNN